MIEGEMTRELWAFVGCFVVLLVIEVSIFMFFAIGQWWSESNRKKQIRQMIQQIENNNYAVDKQ